MAAKKHANLADVAICDITVTATYRDIRVFID